MPASEYDNEYDADDRITELESEVKRLRDIILRYEKTTEWQPIETAPKDRRIRLWKPGNVSDNSSEQHGEWNVDKYARTPRPYWDYEGHRITESREHQPTHWMDVADAPIAF